eukprot:gnl/TRDRNA2_/TRDRNA2_188254_c0_seq1.p1 gnl/TRDRNA2_/TRDRNA2_188254_c0~~gnl/TRDRNA2_/TRDRNA2_188254_c0_seq1.p1  ORF type:complete len:299 (+),score=61.65 gnl/TRDRNA2_/TRDRNA2_188254_c0_seq1:63-899(+)
MAGATVWTRESLKDKGGLDLFKELMRLMPTNHPEDYYKNGVWNDEMMRLDCELISAHRGEAGAPEPIPLEDVPHVTLPAHTGFPAFPGAAQPMVPSGIIKPMATSAGPIRPYGSGSIMPGGSASTSAATVSAVPQAVMAPKAGAGVPPVGVVVPPAVAAAQGATGASAGTNASDLKSIALFVSKWKLEPSRTKLFLARLTPLRRRLVMQNFKYAASDGASPIAKLEEYVQQCEKTNEWGSGPEAAEAAAEAAPQDGTGVKRPAEDGAEPAAKKPNTAS